MSLGRYATLVTIFALVAIDTADAVSCKSVLAADPTSISGLYDFTTCKSGTFLQVYCEMALGKGGYTFLAADDIESISNEELQEMITDRSSVLIRAQTIDGTQAFAEIKQLPQNAHIPIDIFVDTYGAYEKPLNVPHLGYSYLYVGFDNKTVAASNGVHGVQLNNRSIIYNNTGSHRNGYMALFANWQEKQPRSFPLSESNCVSFLSPASFNPSRRCMPCQYFMFSEIGFGGAAGCSAITDQYHQDKSGIVSLAIGFR